LPTPTAQAKTDASEGFAFAVCGDSRDGDATYRRLLTRIQEDGNAFLIHLGDVAESGEPAQYARVRALMAGFHLPFYVVPGNHDLRGSSLAAFLDFSPHHVAHQSFDYGLVHLTLADSSRGGLDNQELTWLRTDLDASHQPVKMVFVHHPPFDPQGGSHVMGSGAQSFVTLMTQMHVRYVFAGHIHAYGRAERDGVTYIVSGGCGSPLSYPPDRGGFFHYVQVRVQGTETSDRVIRLDAAMNP
jgi:3',5'-cyclic AMP phosphodiesterase CpdA